MSTFPRQCLAAMAALVAWTAACFRLARYLDSREYSA